MWKDTTDQICAKAIMSSVKDFFNFGFIFHCHNLGFSSFIDEPFGFSFCNYT